MAPVAILTVEGAADFTWGGGSLDWTDTTASGWNGGPVGARDNATIGSGIVTVTTNVGILNTVNLTGTSIIAITTGQLITSPYTTEPTADQNRLWHLE